MVSFSSLRTLKSPRFNFNLWISLIRDSLRLLNVSLSFNVWSLSAVRAPKSEHTLSISFCFLIRVSFISFTFSTSSVIFSSLRALKSSIFSFNFWISLITDSLSRLNVSLSVNVRSLSAVRVPRTTFTLSISSCFLRTTSLKLSTSLITFCFSFLRISTSSSASFISSSKASLSSLRRAIFSKPITFSCLNFSSSSLI